MKLANLWFWGSIAAFTVSLTVPARAQVCTSNADCASPLTCKAGASRCSQSGGMLPDGGIYVSNPECTPELSQCTWSFVRCQGDSECVLPQWACLPIPGQTVIKTCFPQAIVCSAGQACPTGWSCLDLGQWQDGKEPLEMWNIETGTQFCWPDSLKDVLDGTAEPDPSGLRLPPSGSSDGTKGAGAADASGLAPVDSTSTSKSSGCALDHRRGPASSSVMLLALLGLLSLRRAARKS